MVFSGDTDSETGSPARLPAKVAGLFVGLVVTVQEIFILPWLLYSQVSPSPIEGRHAVVPGRLSLRATIHSLVSVTIDAKTTVHCFPSSSVRCIRHDRGFKNPTEQASNVTWCRFPTFIPNELIPEPVFSNFEGA